MHSQAYMSSQIIYAPSDGAQFFVANKNSRTPFIRLFSKIVIFLWKYTWHERWPNGGVKNITLGNVTASRRWKQMTYLCWKMWWNCRYSFLFSLLLPNENGTRNNFQYSAQRARFCLSQNFSSAEAATFNPENA